MTAIREVGHRRPLARFASSSLLSFWAQAEYSLKPSKVLPGTGRRLRCNDVFGHNPVRRLVCHAIADVFFLGFVWDRLCSSGGLSESSAKLISLKRGKYFARVVA
jgi:hypothetical protein